MCHPAIARVGQPRAADEFSRWGQSEPLRQILRPFCSDAVVERLARTGDDRKGLLAPERNAGVDDHARIAPVGLGVVAHRVERRAPSAVDDIDLIARIGMGSLRYIKVSMRIAGSRPLPLAK